MAKQTCKCSLKDLGWLLAGVLVLGLGLWSLLNAALMQFGGASWLNAWLWYSGGALLLCLGKHLKCKAAADCPLH